MLIVPNVKTDTGYCNKTLKNTRDPLWRGALTPRTASAPTYIHVCSNYLKYGSLLLGFLKCPLKTQHFSLMEVFSGRWMFY